MKIEKKNKKLKIDDLDKIELINLTIKDLMVLLDEINNKIESGNRITKEDVEISNKILDEIKKINKANPYYEEIGVTDANGLVVVTSRLVSVPESLRTGASI